MDEVKRRVRTGAYCLNVRLGSSCTVMDCVRPGVRRPRAIDAVTNDRGCQVPALLTQHGGINV